MVPILFLLYFITGMLLHTIIKKLLKEKINKKIYIHAGDISIALVYEEGLAYTDNLLQQVILKV